jgi:prepilin-type N-terminal cleavage/methylation domain-containing protein
MKLPIITFEKLKLLIQPLSVKSNSIQKADNGFTLVEMVFVMVIIAILSAIAAPSWVALINRTRLNDAQDRVYQYLRLTQTEAKRKKTSLQVQIKVGKLNPTDPDEDTLILAVCPPGTTNETACGSTYIKERLSIPGLELNTSTTLTTINQAPSAPEKVRYIKFNDKGEVLTDNGQEIPAIITMQIENGGTMKRCVIVQTILGAMITEKDDNCANK